MAASVAALALGSTMAVAEGLERVNLDTSFMYENGTHAEFSFGSVNPSIPADWTIGSSNNLASSFAVTNFAAKTSLGDKFDVGLWRTNNSNGVAIDWGPTFPIAADLTVSGLVGLVRYSVSDNFSVMAGIKRLQSDAGASVSVPLGRTPSDGTEAAVGMNPDESLGVASYTIPSGSATTSVYGIAYERPEIAMRLELLLEGETEMSMNAAYSIAGSGDVFVDAVNDGTAELDGDYTGSAKIGIGDAMTFNFQTGIAANTLLFGSVRSSRWKNNQTVAPNPLTGSSPLSTFGDGQSYTIGVARKFSDSLSGSISTFNDPASGCGDASALSPTCENRSISLGAKIALSDDMNLSLGTTWSRRGTATVDLSPLTATTSKSVVTSYGMKLSYKF